MKWFGANWGAPALKELEQVPIPIGEKCFHCGGDFIEHDRGFVLPFSSAEGTRDTFWHRTCFASAVLGNQWSVSPDKS